MGERPHLLQEKGLVGVSENRKNCKVLSYVMIYIMT